MQEHVRPRCFGRLELAERVPRRALGLIAAFLTAALFSTAAPAMAFSYKSCSTDVWTPTVLPANFGTAEFERDTASVSNYANNEYDQWNLHFTPSVGMVWPRLRDMNTEANYDWLDLSSGLDSRRYTGSNPDGFSSLFRILDSTGGSWANLLALTWFTDGSVNIASTPRIDGFTAVCYPSTPALVSWPMSHNTREEGMLLGSDDVHYFTVPHKPGERMAISVEVLAASTPTVDLDLYVSKTVQFPDGNSADYVDADANSTGTIGGGGAFINIGANGNGNYYIGVHSYGGAAHYVIHASGYLNTSKTTYTICSETSLSTAASYWPNFSSTIKQVSARVAQFTQGGIWPMTWSSRVLGDGACTDKACTNISDCDLVIMPARYNDCGCCSSTNWNRTPIPNPANCSTAYNKPADMSNVLAHELGHTQFRFLDEYETIGAWSDGNRGAYCGHSLMNGPNQRTHTLCNTLNHCTDPAFSTKSQRFFSVPSGHSCAAGSDPWSALNASGLVPYAVLQPGWTPDQWDSLRQNAQFMRRGVTYTP